MKKFIISHFPAFPSNTSSSEQAYPCLCFLGFIRSLMQIALKYVFQSCLKNLLVLIHQTFVQHARNQMSGLAVVIKRDRRHFLQIIIKTITALHIIDQSTSDRQSGL